MTLAEIRNICRPLVPIGFSAFYQFEVSDYEMPHSEWQTEIMYLITLVRTAYNDVHSLKSRDPETLVAMFRELVAEINGQPQATESEIVAADAGEFAEVQA